MIQSHALDTTLAKAVLPALQELREQRPDIQKEIDKMIAGFKIAADDYETIWIKAAMRIYDQEPTTENWQRLQQLRDRADEVVEQAIQAFANNFRQLWY